MRHKKTLTPEERVLLAAFKSEYLAHSLSCEPADMPRATAAIRRAYLELKITPPEMIYAASPMGAMRIIADLDKHELKYIATNLWGQMELFWIARYLFPQKHLGMVYSAKALNKLDIMHEISLSCSWWYPYENACIICDRPESVKKDDNKLLHNPTGPSIRFRDGFEMYSWHGTRIPKDWITEKTLTAQQALRWVNIDQRTAACQILGWATILKELDAKVIHADPNPYIGTLYEAELPDHGVQKFLSARCGTGAEVVVLASNKARTAREAGAMSYGLAEIDYNPAFRT